MNGQSSLHEGLRTGGPRACSQQQIYPTCDKIANARSLTAIHFSGIVNCFRAAVASAQQF